MEFHNFITSELHNAIIESTPLGVTKMQGAESSNAYKVAECIEKGFDANDQLDALSGKDWKDFNDLYKEGKQNQRETGEKFLPGLMITVENGSRGYEQKGPFPNGKCEIDESTTRTEKPKPAKSEMELVQERVKELKEEDEAHGDFDYIDDGVKESVSKEFVERPYRVIEKSVDDCYEDSTDTNHDAKLRLRENLLGLNKVDPETRANVMEKLEEKYGLSDVSEAVDAEAKVLSGMKVDYAIDANGNDIKSQPLKITFNDKFHNGQAKETIYMDKTLEENAEIAEKLFKDQKDTIVTGGGFTNYEQSKQDGTLPKEKLKWWDRVKR